MSMLFTCGQYTLDLSMPNVMGILNCTPDSFSDGGMFIKHDDAIRCALQMVASGADIIDVGGESTRPNAAPVSEQEELDRVIPVIETLTREIDLPLSVDTYKPAVMQAAIAAGACFINDVKALQSPQSMQSVANYDVPICLMHMRGEPLTMQQNLVYEDLFTEIIDFFQDRIAACTAAGIDKSRLLIDPGFGFGKSVQHNLALIKHLARFKSLGVPILIGVSRKSTIGQVLERPVTERLAGGLALTVLAVLQGASIIRTHDVQATRDVIRMTAAVQQVD